MKLLYSLFDNKGHRVFPHAAYVLDVASQKFQTFLFVGTYYFDPQREDVKYHLRAVGHVWPRRK